MNFANKIAAVFALILLAGVTGATSSFSFFTPTNTISVEKGIQASVPLEFANLSGNAITVNVLVDSTENNLEVVMPQTQFVLNKNESTSFTLTLKPKEGIQDGTYNLNIRSTAGSETLTRTLEVRVFSVTDFDFYFDESGFEVCSDKYTKELNVRVQNNSSQEKKFLLFSDSEEFVPSFSPEELIVQGNSSRSSRLTIHLNDSHSKGPHSVPLYVKSPDAKIIEKTLEFSTKECADGTRESGEFFGISLDKDFLELKPNQEKPVMLSIKNLLNEKQKVFVSVESALEVSKPPYEVELLPLEERQFQAIVKGREEDSFGTNKVTFFVWNENDSKERDLIVEVAKMHKLEINILKNDLTERICSAVDFEVFEIEVSNKGSEEEVVLFDVKNDHETIGTTISEREIHLLPFEKQIIKVVVQPAFHTPIGEKEIVFEAKSLESGKKFQEILRFTVIEAFEQGFSNVLQIASAPLEIKAAEGEEKDFEIAVKNNGNAVLENVEIRVFGADSQAEFLPRTIPQLNPDETKTVTVFLRTAENAVARDYDLTLEARSGVQKAMQPLHLSIRPKGATGIASQTDSENQSIAGLAGLVFNASSLLFLAFIILIVALAVLVMYLLNSSNKQAQKPVWLSVKNDAVKN